MTVFLLYESYCGDSPTIVSIHSSYDLALKAKEKLELLDDEEYCTYFINDRDID
jgi:hypothetical protein